MKKIAAIFCLLAMSLTAFADSLSEYNCITSSKNFGTSSRWIVRGLSESSSIPIGHSDSFGSAVITFTTFSKDGQIFAQILGLDARGFPADVGMAVKIGEPLNMNSSDRTVETKCSTIP